MTNYYDSKMFYTPTNVHLYMDISQQPMWRHLVLKILKTR